MPWLSRRNSHEEEMGSTRSTKSHSPIPLSTKSSVTFIPAMIDGSCGTSPSMQRKSPMQMMLMDMRIMAQNIRCVPEMIGSTMNGEMMRNMFSSWRNMRDMCLQGMLAVVELWMMIMIVPAFLVMPGFAFTCMCCICAGTIMLLCWPLNGEQVIGCASKGQQIDLYAGEKWVYINGTMTSLYQMQSHLMQLSSIFCRPMTGVHNRTNGIVIDMMSMLFSNVLPLHRSTSTALYSHLRDCLLNPSVHRVIIMSHGTGASIMSMTIDRLHADLPIDVLSKMEIYTFGSAASHLSNPCLTLNSPMNTNPRFTRADGSIVSPVKATLATKGHRIEDTERVIPHIEHYAISNDFFARCGIMHHTRSVLDNTMCGREFIVNSHHTRLNNPSTPSGFMMTQYLNMLFPTSSTTACILDDKIEVDIQTAEKREFTAQGMSTPLKSMELGNRRSRSSNMTNSPIAGEVGTPMTKAEKRASWGTVTMGNEGVAAARKCAKDCEGKTVRQLSRLWMYAGGARPVGEGVGMVNGVGLGLNGAAGMM